MLKQHSQKFRKFSSRVNSGTRMFSVTTTGKCNSRLLVTCLALSTLFTEWSLQKQSTLSFFQIGRTKVLLCCHQSHRNKTCLQKTRSKRFCWELIFFGKEFFTENNDLEQMRNLGSQFVVLKLRCSLCVDHKLTYWTIELTF